MAVSWVQGDLKKVTKKNGGRKVPSLVPTNWVPGSLTKEFL